MANIKLEVPHLLTQIFTPSYSKNLVSVPVQSLLCDMKVTTPRHTLTG